MVKGINKQMIVLKIDGNRVYDSACFILKNEVDRAKETQKDMLYEANRLLGEMELKGVKKKKKGKWKIILLGAVMLVVGVAVGFVSAFFIL